MSDIEEDKYFRFKLKASRRSKGQSGPDIPCNDKPHEALVKDLSPPSLDSLLNVSAHGFNSRVDKTERPGYR